MADKKKPIECIEKLVNDYPGRLLYCRSEKQFYSTDKDSPPVFNPLSPDNLRDYVVQWALDNEYYHNRAPIMSFFRELEETLKIDTTRNPCVFTQTTFDSKYIVFDDTTLNADTLETIPHGEHPPAFKYLPIDYPTDPLETPHFNRYLRSTFVDPENKYKTDNELIDYVIKVLAYYFTPENPKPLAVILYGTGANGKSVFLDLLRLLHGDSKNLIATASMEDLSGRFGLTSLVGKSLNIVTEDQSRRTRLDKMKSLISQEYVELEKKHEGPVSFRPRAKHIFSTNKRMSFEELDYATTRRFKIIPFHITFMEDPPPDSPLYTQMDKNLIYKRTGEDTYRGHLVDELPGIVYKLLSTLEELKENNFAMKPPAQVKEQTKQLRISSTNALEFFYECYEIDPSKEEPITNDIIYNRYEQWCVANDKTKYKLSPTRFANILRKNLEDEDVRYPEKVWSPVSQNAYRALYHIKPIKQPWENPKKKKNNNPF